MTFKWSIRREYLYALSYAVSILSVSAVVLFILLVGFFELLNPEILNLTLIGLLVILTAIYAFETQRNVYEMQKGRQAQFYRDALQNFYSPLINHPVFWKIDHSTFAAYCNQAPDSESADGRRAKEFLDTINKYQHLADKGLEPYLNKFQMVVTRGATNLEPKEKDVDEKYQEFKKEFYESLSAYYNKYKGKLWALSEESLF